MIPSTRKPVRGLCRLSAVMEPVLKNGCVLRFIVKDSVLGYTASSCLARPMCCYASSKRLSLSTVVSGISTSIVRLHTSRKPAANSGKKKFVRNVLRDQKVMYQLKMLGWRVAIIWESGLINKQHDDTLRRLALWLRWGREYLEIRL